MTERTCKQDDSFNRCMHYAPGWPGHSFPTRCNILNVAKHNIHIKLKNSEIASIHQIVTADAIEKKKEKK